MSQQQYNLREKNSLCLVVMIKLGKGFYLLELNDQDSHWIVSVQAMKLLYLYAQKDIVIIELSTLNTSNLSVNFEAVCLEYLKKQTQLKAKTSKSYS